MARGRARGRGRGRGQKPDSPAELARDKTLGVAQNPIESKERSSAGRSVPPPAALPASPVGPSIAGGPTSVGGGAGGFGPPVTKPPQGVPAALRMAALSRALGVGKK